MKKLKKIYPNYQIFYDMFVNSNSGQESWKHATKKYPKFNEGGFDMDMATDDIFTSMEMALDSEDFKDSEIEDFIAENEDDLREAIMNGLT